MITFKAINAPAGETQWVVGFYSSSGLLKNSSPAPISNPIQLSATPSVSWITAGTNHNIGYVSSPENPQLEDGTTYIVDFQAGTITAAEQAAQSAIAQYPSWLRPLAKLLPTPPWVGPPLPLAFNVTWPWYKGG